MELISPKDCLLKFINSKELDINVWNALGEVDYSFLTFDSNYVEIILKDEDLKYYRTEKATRTIEAFFLHRRWIVEHIYKSIIESKSECKFSIHINPLLNSF